eukprot:TRINITY_DN5055_c0_g2_i2.p1 TRINITY_DN5055_c0_g2~~TRINITY_DN5055_c0_g2_i2.p1  ORF type:complete len:185 (+),score=43.61 TRINITY_DN5055_c0_g2_i2:54-608(+)
MPLYDSMFLDFERLVFYYGYISLFVLVFPLAPLVNLLWCVVSGLITFRKLAFHTRRPEPRSTFDIGVWYSVFNVMTVLAIVTNCALVVFQTSLFSSWSDAGRLVAFIFMEHGLCSLKFINSYCIPELPRAVKESLQRQEHVIDVLVLGNEEKRDPGSLPFVAPPESSIDVEQMPDAPDSDHHWD